MNITDTITNELKAQGSAEKAAHLSYFFKTGKGQYGENDRFLGVTVPETRRVAKAHAGVEMADCNNSFGLSGTKCAFAPCSYLLFSLTKATNLRAPSL